METEFTMPKPQTVADRLLSTKEAIERIARRSGRDPDSVQLLCVSKTQPPEIVEEALIAGHRAFGENRVQEAQRKWAALRKKYSGVRLHLIGPLQSNKVREAIETFDVIETVDRPKIAEALSREMQRTGKTVKFFVEINTGSEPQKAGILPPDADDFLNLCRNVYGLPITGLMCIPPAGEQASPHFALLAQIAERNGLEELSMGMSADYPLAIQLGATSVRLGTVIFGERT